MMKRIFALCVATVAAGCYQQAPSTGSSPVAKSSPGAKFETTSLQVASSSVKEEDPSILLAANWTSKQCALTLEGVTDTQVEIPATIGAPTHLAGYFIDPNDQPAGDFKVALMGTSKNYVFPAKTGWDRTDVADYFGKSQLASSGYDLNVDLSGVPVGTYKLNYVVERTNGKFFCETGKNIVIAESAAAPSPADPALSPADIELPSDTGDSVVQPADEPAEQEKMP